MSHILIIYLFVDRIVGWTHSLVWGPAQLFTRTCRWHFGTLLQEGDSWLIRQFYIHLSRDFCTEVHSGGTSLHPHQSEYGSPPPRSHQHLLLLFILLEDADIVFTIGFYFLKCYTLIGCVCVHVCTLGYMCGGRRTTVGSQGLVSGCQVWELRASACWAMSGFLYLPSVTLLPPPLRLVYRQVAHTCP